MSRKLDGQYGNVSKKSEEEQEKQKIIFGFIEATSTSIWK